MASQVSTWLTYDRTQECWSYGATASSSPVRYDLVMTVADQKHRCRTKIRRLIGQIDDSVVPRRKIPSDYSFASIKPDDGPFFNFLANPMNQFDEI